jgi:6-phosphogluconolactonase
MSKLTSILVSLAIISTLAMIPLVSSNPENGSGAVYTMTNNVTDNKIVRFDMALDGKLSNPSTFSTKGLGTGSSLGSQGGVILTNDGKNLLVVDAGSNEISVFQVGHNDLKLTDKISSGGIMPISLTTKDNLVYVVNAGGNGNIAGFHLSNGKLSAIPKSIRPLSSNSSGPAEISFNPSGKVLVVTEKNTNLIDTYTVKNGIPQGPVTHHSNGITPFGFAFDNRGQVVVSEATTGALSSYSVSEDGKLKTISGSIPDFHAAPCWVVVTNNGNFTYVNNAHDGTMSSYAVDGKGKLTLLEKIAGMPGKGNIDMALNKNSKFVYSLNSVPNTIVGFQVSKDGSLKMITTVGTPAGANGLAAN